MMNAVNLLADVTHVPPINKKDTDQMNYYNSCKMWYVIL